MLLLFISDTADGALISVKNNNQVNVYTLNNLFTPIISIPVNLTQRIIGESDLYFYFVLKFRSNLIK
uniref:Uncharacterized protein n=1 Tax=Trichobilharzia regenti TaxID=157069 RepID=A0AA85ISI6_TRIRE|nr:unnamed protein product [Trichobilharzia regenti]